MNAASELLKAIMQVFKIESNVFIEAQIADAIKAIDVKDYPAFLKQLCGEGFEYRNPLDRVEIVSKRFKAKNDLPLIEQRKSEAEAIYDSLYLKHSSLTTLAHKNRNNYPTDWDLFGFCEFGKMTVADTKEPAFSKKDIYAIKQLGREWFMNMTNRTQPEAIRQIESIVKVAQTTKALSPGERKVLEVIR